MDTYQTSSVVRIVVQGQPYSNGQLDNSKEARTMLLDSLASTTWPDGTATLAVTPGGFIRTRIPDNYDGGRGWESNDRDLCKLILHAEAAVEKVVSDDVLESAKSQTRYLTVGVDLFVEEQVDVSVRRKVGSKYKVKGRQNRHLSQPTFPFSNTHAELVAVLDTSNGEVVRWTGKSYPVDSQQHTLVHVTDLSSHLVDIGSERLLVLGCHDLLMFIDRGRKSSVPHTPRGIRKNSMRSLAMDFEPTMVLHHPHYTYSPKVWASAWGALRKMLPTTRVWASGIAFYGNPKPKPKWKPWQALDKTLSASASKARVFDVVIKGYDP